ncbi:recombinase family protein [Lichenicoccus roseus]|uniref:Recombinase family protein n=1 Tax=Lichenicoccus roseus TaxID=2683649 RepID=A0A5R9IZ57_9PROT|nr:recombinase family protein [Lichenicoccus roseus]TLU70582.1 recombinase family protein [Lichenicoccus roseus]
MTTERFVAYYRVSTAKQGASGLGLEAQRETVRQYLCNGGYPPLAEFTDIESGANADRPGIAAAILHCQMTGARLVVAKFDRLSRDAEFFYGRFKRTGIRWVAADNPDMNELTADVMMAVAKHERLLASQRTKAALAAAKARGVKLGGYRGKHAPLDVLAANAAKGVVTKKAKADEFATRLLPKMREMQDRGLSLNAMAKELDAIGFRTKQRGKSGEEGRWTATAVRRVLARADASKAA